MQTQLRARDYEQELLQIRSVDQIQLDHSEALGIKRGDVAVIPGEVFRCSPADYRLQNIPLVIKRFQCVDRKVFDMLVHESDTLMRFRGHPNVVSLFSYWTEKPASPYQYKALVQLYEEASLGDMMSTVVLNNARPSDRMVLKWLCDMAKGLSSFHNCGIVHGGIKPSNLFLNSDNTALVGPIQRARLESALATHSQYSRVMIADALPRTMAYWAPELLRGERHGEEADVWALGVALY